MYLDTESAPVEIASLFSRIPALSSLIVPVYALTQFNMLSDAARILTSLSLVPSSLSIGSQPGCESA